MHRRFLVLLLGLSLATALATVGQEPTFEVESWEVRMNTRQPPGPIMDAVGLKPGMKVGEIGAGTGRMTMWMAQRVGPEGHIWANDIDATALATLAERCRREGFDQVEIITGEVLDPLLPRGVLDMVFLINVFHHADDPVILIRNAIPSLKAEGVLVIVECDPDKAAWGGGHHCTPKDTMSDRLDQAGYELVRTEDFLVEDQIYIARPRR